MINNNFIPNVEIKNENGYSPASVRLIAEELGGQVEWDAKKKTAVVEYNNNKMMLTAGDKNAVINGKNIVLPIAVQMVDNRVYTPLRAVAETFHVDIGYHTGIMPIGNPLISIDNRMKCKIGQ